MRPPVWWRVRGLVEVASPVVPAALSLVPGEIRTVQFCSPLTERDHRRLGAWFEDHPQVSMRVFADGLGHGGDLSFLRDYPRLCGLSVDSLDDEAVFSPRSLELLPTTLRALSLEGRARDLGPLTALDRLEELKLRSVTADIAPLRALAELRVLEIRLGGITDLSAISDIGAISYLELWLVRGLADLSFLADMPHLQGLFLQALRNVRSLPDLSACTALEQVHLETMTGLADLAPLANAPALRRLRLVDWSHQRPEDLLPLEACRALHEVSVGMGSDRENLAARALLGIPGSYGGFPWPES